MLLIISMVVTPMLGVRGKEVALPVTANPSEKKIDPNQVIISLTAGAELYLDKTLVTREHLKEQIQELRERRDNVTIFLQCDRGLPYREVRSAMKLISHSGVETISLIVEAQGPNKSFELPPLF